MNDFNSSPELIARYVRDAERMRAEALRDMIFRACAWVAASTASFGAWVRSVKRRRKWNLSVPAPHH